jgi:DNA-binding CsgD family transcriptional regulator
LHDAVRLGEPGLVTNALAEAAATTSGAALLETMARHAGAAAARDAFVLAEVAQTFADQGAWLLASEAQAGHAALLAESPATAGGQAVAWSAALSMAWESRCQGARTPLLLARPPVGLSDRQLEIAGDAARGASSAEIGRQHVISIRTVDNHLGKVYRALGLSGRDELAARLGPALDRSAKQVRRADPRDRPSR